MEDTTTDVAVLEETPEDIANGLVVVGAVVAAAAVVTGCVFLWKAIDRKLRNKYVAEILAEAEKKEKKTK